MSFRHPHPLRPSGQRLILGWHLGPAGHSNSIVAVALPTQMLAPRAGAVPSVHGPRHLFREPPEIAIQLLGRGESSH